MTLRIVFCWERWLTSKNYSPVLHYLHHPSDPIPKSGFDAHHGVRRTGVRVLTDQDEILGIIEDFGTLSRKYPLEPEDAEV